MGTPGDTIPEAATLTAVPLSPQGLGCHHAVTGPVGGRPRVAAGPQSCPTAGHSGTAHGGEHTPSSTPGCHQGATRHGLGCHSSPCSAPSPSAAPTSPVAQLGTPRSHCKDGCHHGRCHQGHPTTPPSPRRGAKRISRYGTHGGGGTQGGHPIQRPPRHRLSHRFG